MPVDLNKKVGHLIADFRALIKLINAIEHELEKRIVARHGLIKIESLGSIVGAYKNQIKIQMPRFDRNDMGELESFIRQLSNDIQTGIRKNRNYQSGHYLKQSLIEIPEHWLFLGKSTFAILEEDLAHIERLLLKLDPQYECGPTWLEPGLSAVQLWRSDDLLGSPKTDRFVHIYGGPWTPNIGSTLPGNTGFQDATIRVVGLMTMINQCCKLAEYFTDDGEPYERILTEILLNDFFSLEEAIFQGNPQSRTLSLVDEWQDENDAHSGVGILTARHGELGQKIWSWKANVRDKVCAHMDQDVSAAMLTMSNWPIDLDELREQVNILFDVYQEAACMDIRTRFFTPLVQPIKNGQIAHKNDAPAWDET